MTAAFDVRDMPDKAERTRRQLAEVETSYGPGSSDVYVAGSECAICGAIPGFNHAAGCENDDDGESYRLAVERDF